MLIARFKVPAFVATLGVMYMVRGIALLMTNGLTYNNLGGRPELGNTGFDWLGFNRLLGVPIGVVVHGGDRLPRQPRAEPHAVRPLALRVRRQRARGGTVRRADQAGADCPSTCCPASAPPIAGLILSSQLTSAGPTAGTTYELTAIAAVVIGGAALTGGRGNIRGTLLGAFVIGFLSDGLVIIGISSYWQTVFTGAVIVLAVLLNAVQYRRRVKAPRPIGGSSTSPQKAV